MGWYVLDDVLKSLRETLGYLADFPPAIADGLMLTIIVIVTLSAWVVIFKGLNGLSVRTFVAPLVFMGLAYVARWLFQQFNQPWLSTVFSVSALIAVIWGFVVLIMLLKGSKK